MELKTANLITRAIDATSRSVDAIFSTEAIDSHGEIVDQATWQLARYKANPVVLWNHGIMESSPWSFGGAVRPEDMLPIGRAENVRIEAGALQARVVFASTPLAR